MKIMNIHKRIINQPKANVSDLISKLASEADVIWPNTTWPAIRFKDGLKVGSKGGHGIIRYTITQYDPLDGIQFKFTQPKGFHGIHEFRIKGIDGNTTEISHTIDIKTSFIATLQWVLFIRWLHDALIEDAFDNIETHFTKEKKEANWSVWVKFWRWVFKRNTKKYPKASLN